MSGVPELEIGPGAGSGGGIAGIPTKYLILGAGALGVAALLFMNRSGGGGPATGNEPSPQLGPNAALALGGLETRVLQESGRLQEQFADYFGDLSSIMDTRAGELNSRFDQFGSEISGVRDLVSANSAQGQAALAQLADQLGRQIGAVGTQVGGISGQIGGLSSQLDGQAAALADQIGAGFNTQSALVNAWGNFLALLGQQNQDLIRGYGPTYQQRAA